MFIRLEAMLQPNIGFTFERALTMFRRSDIKWTDLDESWSTLSTLSGAGSGRFWARSASSESWRARRNFVFFCQVNNARPYRFPVGQISRNLNTTRRSVSRWILSEQHFETFPIKTQKMIFSQRLVTSGRHNSPMTTDRQKVITKISLCRMSTFHF